MRDINEITERVSEYLYVPYVEMKSRSRELNIVKARHIAMFVCRSLTSENLGAIGSIFNKDHATVIHACKSVENQMQTNKYYCTQVLDIIERIKTIDCALEMIATDEVFQENDFYPNN